MQRTPLRVCDGGLLCSCAHKEGSGVIGFYCFKNDFDCIASTNLIRKLINLHHIPFFSPFFSSLIPICFHDPPTYNKIVVIALMHSNTAIEWFTIRYQPSIAIAVSP
jgi:hypothetical protein